MMTIILSACMATDPNVCKDYRLPVEGDMDTTQCALFAPPYFAQWADEHPGWSIVKWKCTPGDQKDL
jgi:hypothetical protein